MKKIQFDLDYWMAHHPMLETRDGRKARILATDLEGPCKVCFVAKTHLKNEVCDFITDMPYECHTDGYAVCLGFPNDADLFMLIH